MRELSSPNTAPNGCRPYPYGEPAQLRDFAINRVLGSPARELLLAQTPNAA